MCLVITFWQHNVKLDKALPTLVGVIIKHMDYLTIKTNIQIVTKHI